MAARRVARGRARLYASAMCLAIAPIVLISMLVGPAAAGPAPVINVRARPWLDGVRAAGEGRMAVVIGVLRDNLNQPVPGAPISVRTIETAAATRSATVETATDGTFRAQLRLSNDGRHRLAVRYPGNALLAQADESVDVVLGRTPVRLTLSVPAQVRAEHHNVATLSATDEHRRPLGDLSVHMALDDVELEIVTTGSEGLAKVPLPKLRRGRHQLDAEWPGDDDRRPADTRATFDAATPLEVGLEAVTSSPAPGAPIVFHGAVVGGAGADLRIMVLGDDRIVANTYTDADGRFLVEVDPNEVGAGSMEFRALTDGRERLFIDASSNAVRVDVPESPPPSPAWTWVPLGLATLSLLAAGWRHRPRLHPAARDSRAQHQRPPPQFTLDTPPTARHATGELVVDVFDGLTELPLVAHVVLLGVGTDSPDAADLVAPPGVSAQTNAAGHATLIGDADRVWVAAAGYAPECHRCAVPPGGHAIVRLMPIRARIQRIYEDALARAGRPRLRFGRETPREAGRALRNRGAPAPEVAALIDIVEAACFGGPEPGSQALTAAHQLATCVAQTAESPQ